MWCDFICKCIYVYVEVGTKGSVIPEAVVPLSLVVVVAAVVALLGVVAGW